MIKKAFGEVLKEVRTARGMSQDALAFASDLDRTYISLLERGLRQPSLSTLFSLAAALDTTAEELVKRVRVRVEG
jgi:transcriptional regulator with XRE-family HTH domain